jgi:translation initiation factor IF-3
MAENERHYRINREIVAPRLRLVDAKGGQLGIVSLDDAMRRASEMRLDLVEVAPEANPPVARLMDFGKFRYTQQKHEQAARKRQHKVVVKEIKFHVKIAPHDYEVKKRMAARFLEKGDKVKLVIAFRGREAEHVELGMKLLTNLIAEVSDLGVIEHRDESEAKYKSITLTPKVKNQPTKTAAGPSSSSGAKASVSPKSKMGA